MLSRTSQNFSWVGLCAFVGLLLMANGNLAQAQTSPAATPDPNQAIFPGADWQTATPESMGFSTARLEGLRTWLKAGPTTSMMVVVKGRVIFSYGDTSKVSIIASARKSVLAMLMGKYVVSGKLDLSKTVVQLGLQEKTPFVGAEEHATLEDLMVGRSGVYISQKDDLLTQTEPQRGIIYPGTMFFYNNWEFNAAGTAFEKVVGQNIYDALETDLAKPLGMQDFHRDIQHKMPETGSVHPIYHMALSTRDMARIGLLMEQRGKWGNTQLIDSNWVSYMTSVQTRWDEMNPALFLREPGAPERWGFGLGWWVWDAQPFPSGTWFSTAPFRGAFEARGTGGQYITVLPVNEIVIAHKLDLDQHKAEEYLTQQDWDTITNMVISAQCHGPCPVK